MRIIGGDFGGRVIQPPLKKWPTRPTTDMAKEALYNILANSLDFRKVSMLDLFGGTGAHALEFLSRGSTDVTYVDAYGKCVHWLKQEVKKLDVEEHIEIVKADVLKFIPKCNRKYDVIFADPPYAIPFLAALPDKILNQELLKKDGLLIIEHGNNVSFEDHSNYTQHRSYGQSRFSFFSD